jgi:hypothetical protein
MQDSLFDTQENICEEGKEIGDMQGACENVEWTKGFYHSISIRFKVNTQTSSFKLWQHLKKNTTKKTI